MSDATYTLTVSVPAPIDDVDAQVRAALAEQGFGVLTEIDVAAVLKAKIDVDVNDYRILGACNPQLAYRGLQADADLGALLPCNVVLRSTATGTDILAVDPHAMMAVSDAPELAAVADEARERLERALAAVAG